MSKKNPRRLNLAKLKPGDPVEVIWADATTAATWLPPQIAENIALETIITRGTLVKVREDALVVALDASLGPDGIPNAYHGAGVIEINSIAKVRKLR